MVFRNVDIVGIAGAVPTKRIKSSEYINVFGQQAIERFISVTGIEEIRKCELNQTASDLGFVAAEKLFAEFEIDKNDVGAILFISSSPDYIWPSSACVLQYRLGLPESCLAFDINLGCSGFVYGIHVASSLLQTMEKRYALIIVGEADKIPDLLKREKPDPSCLMMFGDACTATILEKKENAQSTIITELFTKGSGYKSLIRGGQTRSYYRSGDVVEWSDGIERTINDPYMDGMGVFSFSTTDAPRIMKDFVDKYEGKFDDFDRIYLHQANEMIISRIEKKLKIKSDKVPRSLNAYGNTAGASIPITIIDDIYRNNIKEEINVLMCAFGVGLSMGVVSINLDTQKVLPIIETDDCYLEGELTVR